MKRNAAKERLGIGPAELKKRKKERLLIIALSLFFVGLVFLTYRVFTHNEFFAIKNSVLFFALVNFNIILVLFIIFLIFRNIVKAYSESPRSIFGNSLKTKLITAFISFSFIPTVIMLLISIFYINNSFEKWFSQNTTNVLKSSLEVVNEYYKSEEERNISAGDYFLESYLPKLTGEKVELKYRIKERRVVTEDDLLTFRESMGFDGIELYIDGDFSAKSFSPEFDFNKLKSINEASISEIKKTGSVKSYLDIYGEGSFVRTLLSKDQNKKSYTVIVSKFIPVAFGSRRQEISEAYKNLSHEDPVSYPLKSVYVFILVLMTSVVMLGATWFGFYLAKQISVPLELLGETANSVAKGEYHHLEVQTGSPEINQLIGDFNKMTTQLETKDIDLREANTSLRKTLVNLDEGRRYIQVVLSDVSTGVVSVNSRGVITMVNKHAEEVLELKKESLVGNHYLKVLEKKYSQVFEDMFNQIKRTKKNKTEREINLGLKEHDPKPVKVTLSLLSDDTNSDLGFVVTFDDLTNVLKAQRVTAWTEVAKRIAHEVKNPLTPISLSAQRLRKKFSKDITDPAFNESIEMIIDQTENLKNMVNEFSEFSRLPKTNKRSNEINQVIKSSLMVFQEAHKAIDFNLKLTEPMAFLFDKAQMNRVLINIVGNAVAAVADKKEASVLIATKKNNNEIEISIKDNGPGIDKKIVDKIFEPYVTTKKKGTGLGLSIVKRIIEDHEGDIKAYSNINEGTEVVIRLPLTDLVS